LYGASVWAWRVLSGLTRRFPARAERAVALDPTQQVRRMIA